MSQPTGKQAVKTMKNIALIRTSTIKQEVESQKKEIENAIKKNNDNEIVFIGGAGASAIKLDEIYLANIQAVYDTMERGDVVWAWAIDRIGRNEEVLMAFKNRLIKEGVNLHILNPTLTLLNPDGTVNAGVELAFSLFSTMAKQEMEMKKERFMRAKKRNKEDGKYNGGGIKHGYKLDENNRYIIDDNFPIKEIFESYAKGTMSTYSLAKKYQNLFNTKNYRNAAVGILKILHDSRYIGNNSFPQIVDKDLFEVVQIRLKEGKRLPKVNYKNAPYWCQGLIYQRCENGEVEKARVRKRDIAYFTQINGLYLNINATDSLVYTVLERLFSEYNPQSLIEEIKQQNAETQTKKDYLETELQKLFDKDAELDERYFLSGTVKNYDGLKKSLSLKIKTLQTEINSLSFINEEIEKPTFQGLDEWQIKDVILKHVARIFVFRVEHKLYKIDICTTMGVDVSVFLNTKTRRKNIFKYRFSNSPKWLTLESVRNI